MPATVHSSTRIYSTNSPPPIAASVASPLAWTTRPLAPDGSSPRAAPLPPLPNPTPPSPLGQHRADAHHPSAFLAQLQPCFRPCHPLSPLRRAKAPLPPPFPPESSSPSDLPSTVNRCPILHAWTFLTTTQSNPNKLPMTSTLHQAAPRLLRRTPPPLTVDSPPRPSPSMTLTLVSFATTHRCSHTFSIERLGRRIVRPRRQLPPP